MKITAPANRFWQQYDKIDNSWETTREKTVRSLFKRSNLDNLARDTKKHKTGWSLQNPTGDSKFVINLRIFPFKLLLVPAATFQLALTPQPLACLPRANWRIWTCTWDTHTVLMMGQRRTGHKIFLKAWLIFQLISQLHRGGSKCHCCWLQGWRLYSTFLLVPSKSKCSSCDKETSRGPRATGEEERAIRLRNYFHQIYISQSKL